MNLFRPTSQRNPFVSLLRTGPRRVRVARTIAVPGHFLQWLGIAPEALETACVERGWQPLSYVEVARDAPRGRTPANLPCPDQLQDAVTYATCVASDSLPAELGTSHAALRQAWQQRIATSYARVHTLFKKQRPALILLVQGFETYNAVARCAALRLGIPLLALENTAITNRMVWDNVSGITTNRNSARNYYWRHAGAVDTVASQTYCEQLIRDTKRLKSDEHRSPTATCQRLPDRPTILFLGQVYTDASQIFGLRQWTSPLAVLECCVRWCRQHSYDLVVKLHPKETSGRNTIDDRPYDRLTYRKILQNTELTTSLRELHAIIDHDNVYDTYDLINHCSVAVTINSQAGLEAAIRGTRVVVCGDAFYGGLDFTWDAPHSAYFDCAMQAALSTSESTAAARRFAHVFFAHYCREKSVAGLTQLVQENL